MSVRVVRDYSAQYPDPISARAGDRVRVGPDDPEFPGWWWCVGPDGRAGWVPEQLLQREGQEAILLRDYTARELSVRAGTEVTVQEVISGWVRATDGDGREGWLPQACIAPERSAGGGT